MEQRYPYTTVTDPLSQTAIDKTRRAFLAETGLDKFSPKTIYSRKPSIGGRYNSFGIQVLPLAYKLQYPPFSLGEQERLNQQLSAANKLRGLMAARVLEKEKFLGSERPRGEPYAGDGEQDLVRLNRKLRNVYGDQRFDMRDAYDVEKDVESEYRLPAWPTLPKKMFDVPKPRRHP